MWVVPYLNVRKHVGRLFGHGHLQDVHGALQLEVAQVQPSAQWDAAHLVVKNLVLQ